MKAMKTLTGLHLSELEEALLPLHLDRWRAEALLNWLYMRNARSFDAMTDLSKPARTLLSSHFNVSSTKLLKKHPSPDGTVKLLIALNDGNAVETVLIPEEARRTICFSTQVGCPIRCVFCASGMNGLKRNLSTDEIVEQVLHARALSDKPISSLVVMGIGEPLLNYENLARALEIFHAPWGLGIGYNRITLSTVGILKRLDDLIDAGITPNLALSLHAPNDAIRKQVVPTLPHITIADMVRAGLAYREATHKQVTFEYVMLSGVNDAPEHAEQLSKALRGSPLKVNLIPFNPVKELPYREPQQQRLKLFVEILRKRKVPVTVRKRKGDEVSAACGQLRASFSKTQADRR